MYEISIGHISLLQKIFVTRILIGLSFSALLEKLHLNDRYSKRIK